MEGRVLLIEDNSVNRKVLRERFEAEGTEIAEATTGRAGLEMAARLLPQAVIVSTTLPDMSGTDVIRRLRSLTRTQHVFILFLADEDLHGERLTGLEIGANDFVSSPFDPDEVMLRVRNAIRRANSSNLMDPITGLPAGQLIRDQFRRLLQEPEGSWALLRVHIGGLDDFREAYGFQAANDFLRAVSRILAEALSHDEVEDDFLGYSGSGDFIIVTHVGRAPSMEEEIQSRFQKQVNKHYGFMERMQGYVEIDGEKIPLASVRIWRVIPKDGPFYDIRSLSEALAG